MTQQKTYRSIWNEVLGFEERLRLGASRAGMETRDVELVSLFSQIGRRRRLRTDVTQVSARGPVPQQAGAAAPAAAQPGTVQLTKRGKMGGEV